MSEGAPFFWGGGEHSTTAALCHTKLKEISLSISAWLGELAINSIAEDQCTFKNILVLKVSRFHFVANTSVVLSIYFLKINKLFIYGGG